MTADTSLEQQIPFCARSAPPWRRRAPTQQPARRVRHPEPLRRRGQRCRRHLRVVDPPRPTGTLPVLQRAQPALRVAIPPVDHRSGRDSPTRAPRSRCSSGPPRPAARSAPAVQSRPNPRGPCPGPQRRPVVAADLQTSSNQHAPLSQPGIVSHLRHATRYGCFGAVRRRRSRRTTCRRSRRRARPGTGSGWSR